MTADIVQLARKHAARYHPDATRLIRDLAAEIVRLRGEVAALLEDPDEAELTYRCGDPDSDAIAPAEAKWDGIEARARRMFEEANKGASSAPWERQWEPTRAYWRNKAAAAMNNPQPAGGEAVAWVCSPAENIAQHVGINSEERQKLIDAGFDVSHYRPLVYGDTTPPAAQVQAAPQEGEVPQLVRYGRGSTGSPYLLDQRDDGYWTPWHVAQRELARALAAHSSACELGAVRELVEKLDAVMIEGTMGEGYDSKPCKHMVASIASIIVMMRAALQHRGDSQEVGRG